MTEELKQAARQALEALKHGVAQLNGIGIPLEADPLHSAIAALTRALTQRPAAQEGEAFESADDWLKATGRTEQAGCTAVQLNLLRIGFNAGRASLPAPQQATPEWLHLKSYGYAPGNYMSKCLRCGQTPAGLDKRATSCRPCAEAAYADQQATPDQFADASKMVAPVALRSVHLTRDTAGMCVVRVNGRVAIRDNGDIIDHIATLEWFADTQQATPEPVGEVWGWAIEDKHGVAQAIRPARKEFFGCVQSTDPFTAEDIAKMDREWAGLAPHRIVTVYTRPAPGVPEGFALVPVEPTPEMWQSVNQFAHAGSVWESMLAAAQAKG